MAETAILDPSVVIWNGLEKSGNWRIGGDVRHFLKNSNDYKHSSDQQNLVSFFNRLCKGLANSLNLGM